MQFVVDESTGSAVAHFLRKGDGVLFEPLGQGQSWEEAFGDPARRVDRLLRRLRF